ncbi:c-type cytochrome [Flavobacterium sp. Arc3]|uniref:c-type cytochrome n=1 Tax=Flavobacterium sp. Arc3 TaxID=3046686 RepID=UPI00352E6BDC
MKSRILKMLVLAIAFSSCNKKTKLDIAENHSPSESIMQDNEGLQLMTQKCYTCHSVTTKSHDAIIAPPMIAIKKRYSMQYSNRKDFINALAAYASDPKEENALMMGAINKFNVMPKQNFKKEDLTKIAAYIYDNEIETPKWFDAHLKQNHKNGQGMKNLNKT